MQQFLNSELRLKTEPRTNKQIAIIVICVKIRLIHDESFNKFIKQIDILFLILTVHLIQLHSFIFYLFILCVKKKLIFIIYNIYQ